MEKKNLLQLAVVLFLTQAIFSCSSAEYYRLAPSKEAAYKPVKAKPAVPQAEAVAISPATAPAISQPALAAKPAEPVLEASVAATPAIANKPLTVKAPAMNQPKQELTPAETEALTAVKNRLANLSKAEKKEFKTNVKDVLQENASDTNIVEIIFAILIPPVGVFLHEGITSRFWISLLLTILFFIPGMIYALLVVTDTI